MTKLQSSREPFNLAAFANAQNAQIAANVNTARQCEHGNTLGLCRRCAAERFELSPRERELNDPRNES